MSKNDGLEGLNIDNLFKEDIHAEVEEALKKNVITDEDIEKYKMNKETSVSAGEFIDLLNKALNSYSEEPVDND